MGVKRQRKRRLGWVPNLFTLGNLSLGFFSILLAPAGRTDPDVMFVAGGLILLAVLCDGLDGYAARLLQAKSDLGAQLDSLADLGTFGIAPGVLMYNLVLYNFNYEISPNLSIQTGMLLAMVFPACAAYRLARFNVDHVEGSFSGLPSPVAGLIVALMPLAFRGDISIPSFVLVLIFVISAFLMVSTVKYAKPQLAVFRRFAPVRLAILATFGVLGLLMAGIRYGVDYSAAGLFTYIVIYAMSGIVSFIIHTIQINRM